MNEIAIAGGVRDVPDQRVAYARFSRRLLALVVDAAVVSTSFVVLLIAGSATGIDVVVRLLLVVVLLVALLYDPVLVACTGGTLGHHWTNLRVVDEDTGGHLPIGRAALRNLVKGVLGIPSFVFMTVTQRHQALHDLVSRSTVQVKDLSRAQAYHFVHARNLEPEPLGVSRLRRISVSLAYSFSVFAVLSIASIPLISDTCAISNVCTGGQELLSVSIGVVWIAVSAWLIVCGWRGRLWGVPFKSSGGLTIGCRGCGAGHRSIPWVRRCPAPLNLGR